MGMILVPPWLVWLLAAGCSGYGFEQALMTHAASHGWWLALVPLVAGNLALHWRPWRHAKACAWYEPLFSLLLSLPNLGLFTLASVIGWVLPAASIGEGIAIGVAASAALAVVLAPVCSGPYLRACGVQLTS